MGALANSLSRSTQAAMLVALGFAVSGGMWLLSVEAEFVTVPLALQLLALWWILGMAAEQRGRTWYAVSLGVIVAVAIFGYLTSVFLIVVGVVGFVTGSLAPRTKLRQIGVFMAVVLLLVIPVFWLAMDAWLGRNLSLLTGLGGQGVYGVLHWFNVPQGIYAFLRSIGLYPGLAMNDSTRDLLATAAKKERTLFFTFYGLIGIIALLPLLCLLWRLRTVWARAKRPLLVLLTWTFTFAAFAFYWVPGDITFWIPTLVAWWLFTALCYVVCGSGRWWHAAVLVVLIVGVVNATQVILPRTVLDSNESYRTAKWIAEETRAEDVILIEADDVTLLTVSYFAERRVLRLKSTVGNLTDLPDWVAIEAKRVNNNGGSLLILDVDGGLHKVE